MKDLLMWDQTIFMNGEVFELDYVPEQFLHREAQAQVLAHSIRPALRGMRPLNVMCTGSPGTGKTTAILKLFEDIEKVTQKVVPVYVNCQANSTRYTVFSQVFRKMFGISPPSSGVSFKKILTEIAKKLDEADKVLVVALDDMNYLFYENEVNDVLYSLLRVHETHPGARVGVIAVLSDTGVPHALDPRVESVFTPEEVEFPGYIRDEVHDILRSRAQLGFFPDVIGEDVLEKVVDYTTQVGDLRVGIDLLKRAGLAAEQRAARKIALEDVAHSFEKSRLTHLNSVMKSLDRDGASLLRLIAGKDGINSGELYEEFHRQTGFGYTRFYETLNRLDRLTLVNAAFTGKGMRGRSRMISLRYPAEEIQKRL